MPFYNIKGIGQVHIRVGKRSKLPPPCVACRARGNGRAALHETVRRKIMTLIDWILIGIAWSLIPAALWLKRYYRRQQEKVFRETQPTIGAGIAVLKDMLGK